MIDCQDVCQCVYRAWTWPRLFAVLAVVAAFVAVALFWLRATKESK